MATLGGGFGSGGGGGLIGSFNALAGAITATGAAASASAPQIMSVADAAKKLADAQKQLASDTQAAKEQADGHARAMTDLSTAMIKNEADAAAWGTALAAGDKITAQAIVSLSGLTDKEKAAAAAAIQAADAFGTAANGLTSMSAQADHAADGLQGVAWAMVHATQPTVTLTQAQQDLIQSLAKVADAGGASDLWIGHLISQLQDGTLSFQQFQDEVNQTLQGLTKLGPVMGNTAFEANALNTILDKFKAGANGGWPGTPTNTNPPTGM
jgi:hypothetical protein